MQTSTLAAAIIGFLLGGLTVSIAAELEKDDPQPAHGSGSHGSLSPGSPAPPAATQRTAPAER